MKNLNEEETDIIADINMTPLIDIMLVLLIILMVTSSVSLESGLDINLPSAKSKSSKNEQSAVLVSINKSGAMFINGQESSLELFNEKLKEAFNQSNTKTVIIEGDESSNLGLTVKVMDLAKEAGAEKFAIATQAN